MFSKMISKSKIISYNFRYLEEILGWMFSEDRILYYMELFQSTMWPETVTPVTSNPEMLKEKAKNLIVDFLPDVLSNSTKAALSASIIKLLEQKSINKHLLYIILDVAVLKIFPEFESKKIIESLFPAEKK